MNLEHDAFRLLFEAHPRPMYVSTRDTLQILIVNRAACELYGWSREELQAMTIRDIRPLDEVPHFERAYCDARKIRPRRTRARAATARRTDGSSTSRSRSPDSKSTGRQCRSRSSRTSPGRCGRGSTFRVTLVVATVQRTTDTVDVEQAEALAARVLVIDDEVAVGRSLRLLLAPENDVIAVTSGQDALSRLASGERFDAILCDLMMPDISGIEIYNRLARVAPDYQARIIFMTGGAFTQQARDFLTKLDRPHLDKPFTKGQLRRAIESAMR